MLKPFPFQQESIDKLAPLSNVLIGDDMDLIDVELLLSKFAEDGNGCWIYQGGLGGAGSYGQFSWAIGKGKTRTKGAHILMHLLFVGPIPEGYEVDHKCQVHACGRPDHLEAVTKQVNMDRVRERQETCRNGHTKTEENLYRLPSGRIHGCKECRREAVRRSKSGR